jgi:hypothetical protein
VRLALFIAGVVLVVLLLFLLLGAPGGVESDVSTGYGPGS